MLRLEVKIDLVSVIYVITQRPVTKNIFIFNELS